MVFNIHICSVRRDVWLCAANGRIENRVEITDGTAAVNGLKSLSAQAGHWSNPRRQEAMCSPSGLGDVSQKTCYGFCKPRSASDRGRFHVNAVVE